MEPPTVYNLDLGASRIPLPGPELCACVRARARVYAGTSVHLKDAPRCFLSASFSLLPLCLIDRKCPWTKPARRALPGQATRVPGGFWEERERRRRRLENEEGACAALSVLRVVSTVPKPYHQEVRLEGLRRGDGRKGTATFEANPSSTKTCRPGWERKCRDVDFLVAFRVGR